MLQSNSASVWWDQDLNSQPSDTSTPSFTPEAHGLMRDTVSSMIQGPGLLLEAHFHTHSEAMGNLLNLIKP